MDKYSSPAISSHVKREKQRQFPVLRKLPEPVFFCLLRHINIYWQPGKCQNKRNESSSRAARGFPRKLSKCYAGELFCFIVCNFEGFARFHLREIDNTLSGSHVWAYCYGLVIE